MTDYVTAAFAILKRVQYVRQVCGSLPENIANLELKLQCVVQVHKQHKVKSSPAKEENGIWKVLDDFIRQMIEALDEMTDFLNKSQDSTREQLLEYVKTFAGIGGDCEGFSSLLQRLSDQLQVVLFSVQAINQGDMSQEMETTNELLRAILEIQMKKHDEIDRNVATLKQQKQAIPSSFAEVKDEDDSDDIEQSLKDLMSAQHAGKFTTVRKKKHTGGGDAGGGAGHGRRTSIIKDDIFADPADIERAAEEAATLKRETLKRPFVEFDSEDTERLRKTLRLERGSSLSTIQSELEKRGIDVKLIPKSLSTFMEIKHKSTGIKKMFKKSSFKIRWIVHNPGTSYISLYRSPYEVDCLPEKDRIFLKEAKLQALKFKKGDSGDRFSPFESSLGFAIEQYDGQTYYLRTNDENVETEWKNCVESVTTKSVPAI